MASQGLVSVNMILFTAIRDVIYFRQCRPIGIGLVRDLGAEGIALIKQSHREIAIEGKIGRSIEGNMQGKSVRMSQSEKNGDGKTQQVKVSKS